MSRNVFSINQRTNEDDSQSDPHPEAGLLNSGREDRHDMMTGVQRENVMGHDKILTPRLLETSPLGLFFTYRHHKSF